MTMVETMPDILSKFEKATLKIDTITTGHRERVNKIEEEECGSMCVNMDCIKRAKCQKSGISLED